MMRIRMCAAVCAATIMCVGSIGACAEESDDAAPALLAARIDGLVRENQELRGRMDELSSEISALRDGRKRPRRREPGRMPDLAPIAGREQTPPASQLPARAAAGVAQRPAMSDIPPARDVGRQKKAVSAGAAADADKVSAAVYGFVKADAVYNDSQLGINAQSAPSEREGKNISEFKMTAKETRVGLNIQGPALQDGGKTSGKIEGDFFGSTDDAVSASQFRIRQAYAVLEYPRWSVLAGQAWDAFSPLNPSLLHVSPLWQAGNLGDRHPQAVLTRTFEHGPGGAVNVKLGILDSTAAEAQKHGAPSGEALVSFEPPLAGRPAYFAAGGMCGESDVSTADNRGMTLWAAALAAKFRPFGKVTLSAEAYQGAGLYKFRGGGPAGVEQGKAVRTRGGWMQCALQAAPKAEINIGAGLDDPVTDAQSASSSVWDDNFSAFANLKLKLTPALIWGIEYQYFLTHYKLRDDGDGNRVQSSMIYNF